jgi:hypothetical protein
MRSGITFRMFDANVAALVQRHPYSSSRLSRAASFTTESELSRPEGLPPSSRRQLGNIRRRHSRSQHCSVLRLNRAAIVKFIITRTAPSGSFVRRAASVIIVPDGRRIVVHCSAPHRGAVALHFVASERSRSKRSAVQQAVRADRQRSSARWSPRRWRGGGTT